MSDGLREAIEAGLREVYLIGDEYEPGRLPYYANEKLRAIEPRVRQWHEREVASLKAEVARLREIARKAMEHRVADQPAARGVRFDAALREIAGEGKP